VALDPSLNGGAVSRAASVEEAGAIVAALERFLRDTARVGAPPSSDAPDPWLRAARLEAVNRHPHVQTREPWINV